MFNLQRSGMRGLQDHGRAEDEAVAKKMLYDLQELDAADEADHGSICLALNAYMRARHWCHNICQCMCE